MLGDFSCRIALQLMGYVYPAYKTFKVVNLPATRSNDTLLRHWCQYWTLMAVFTAVAPILDCFVFWVPFYYEAKLALAIYLWANELAGTQYVWARWFYPLVSAYEPVLDHSLAESKAVTKQWLHSNSMRLVAAVQEKVLSWLAQLPQFQQAQQAAAAGGEGAAAGGEPAGAGAGGRRQGAATKRSSGAGGKSTAREQAGKAGEPAGTGKEEAAVPPLAPRFSGFSLQSFYSARSKDLQAEDVSGCGLKTFPLYGGNDSGKDE